MKINNKRKIIILLSIYLALLLSPKVKSDSKNNEIIHENNYSYINYDDKKIIIVNKDYFDYVYDKESNNIYIIDYRNNKNSNFEIVESYKISNKSEMEEIINMLLEYEKENPSNWNRSFNSMLNEWQIHNICHYFGYDIESTEHVDLDNNDENKYKSKVLSKLLGN